MSTLTGPITVQQASEPTAGASAMGDSLSTVATFMSTPTLAAMPAATLAAGDSPSEGSEAPPGQADQGPGLPCLGSSFPVLLLLGAFLMAGRRRRLSEPRSLGASSNQGRKKK